MFVGALAGSYVRSLTHTLAGMRPVDGQAANGQSTLQWRCGRQAEVGVIQTPFLGLNHRCKTFFMFFLLKFKKNMVLNIFLPF